MKILILGARGLLGSNLSLLYSKNHDVLAAGKNKPNFTFTKNYVVDISKEEDLEIIEREKPDFVINCVALTNVDFCEENFELSREIMHWLQKRLQKLVKKKILILFISPQMLFLMATRGTIRKLILLTPLMFMEKQNWRQKN